MKEVPLPEECLLEELRNQEVGVWEALVQGDKEADAKALAEGFLGVYPDGFAAKEDHVRQLEEGPTIASYEFSNCRILPLNKEHAVFAYRADFVRTNCADPEAMYVSSIWRRSAAGWINIFSQDTPALD
ncbi:nuclear transport factor 2 family protein [uncultured Roseovarius sp.]|uniref:nuclear transport factor 2 family protein n=1 Tax=uncultured Roseovarius sp. TaxID=293344 RepID=UPI002639DD26|nr:nuclear transport factor 2 family protein [uncultured Roseovarius sp.]